MALLLLQTKGPVDPGLLYVAEININQLPLRIYLF